MTPVAYFGCWSPIHGGHYLFEPGGHSARDVPQALRDWRLDATYTPMLPDGSQPQGLAHLHHVHGWTVLAMWDRSADPRRASNSAFLANGRRSFDAMRDLARQYFPAQWERISAASNGGIELADMLVIDGPDSAHVTGCLDAVGAKLDELAAEWRVHSLAFGHRLWSELRAQCERRSADMPMHAIAQAALGLPVQRDMGLRSQALRARLRRKGGDEDVARSLDALTKLMGGL